MTLKLNYGLKHFINHYGLPIVKVQCTPGPI